MRAAFLPIFLLLAFSALVTPTKAQIRLGMSIQEFSEIYPEIAPLNTGYSGQLTQDSVWHGLDWRMAFSFGNSVLTGAFFRSEEVGPDPAPFKAAFESISEELTEYFGPYKAQMDSLWPAAFLPNDSLANYRGNGRRWMIGNTTVLLELQPMWRSEVDSLGYKYGYQLHLDLASLTRRLPGVHSPVSPFFIGMPVEQFAVYHPDFVRDGVGYRGYRTRPELLGSILGEWNYWFDKGRLQRYYWLRTYQIPREEDPAQFQRLQETTHALIQQMEKAAGPSTSHVYEADSVLSKGSIIIEQAVWEMPKERIEVQMSEKSPSQGVGYQLIWQVTPSSSRRK